MVSRFFVLLLLAGVGAIFVSLMFGYVPDNALNLTARIWLDASGRITRATLTGSSGNPDIDAAIRTEILTGLQLQAPPPDGMPMPIVMRLKATRPN